MNKKILLTANTSWCLYNFRNGLIKKLIKDGYHVIILAPYDKYVEKLKEMGCSYENIYMEVKGVNPFKELSLIRRYYLKIKKIQPDIVLSYTIKSNIYSALVCGFLDKEILVNITGLGEAFSKKSMLNSIIKQLYQYSFKKVHTVFFQNYEDREIFLTNNLIQEEVIVNIPGSGVDLEKFYPMDKLNSSPKLKFCLIARMLWAKGIGEYIESIKILKKEFTHLEFQLIGKIDVDNKEAIPQKKVDEWVKKGIIEYISFTDDIRQLIREVDCVVLPSYYREGVPKTLIESAAMGKLIVTTNHVGCKEVVDDGVNGFLCKIKDKLSLTDTLRKFILLPEIEKNEMGNRSREKAIKIFDEKIVIDKYLEKINLILK